MLEQDMLKIQIIKKKFFYILLFDGLSIDLKAIKLFLGEKNR